MLDIYNAKDIEGIPVSVDGTATNIKPLSELTRTPDYVNKLYAAHAEKYGKDMVQKWRRSYDIPPPDGESLKMTLERTVPYFKSSIFPLLSNNKNIIISAHGNSIRSIVMDLLSISREDILKTEIGWCEPWIFEFNESGDVINLDIENVSDKNSDSHLPEKYHVRK